MVASQAWQGLLCAWWGQVWGPVSGRLTRTQIRAGISVPRALWEHPGGAAIDKRGILGRGYLSCVGVSQVLCLRGHPVQIP